MQKFTTKDIEAFSTQGSQKSWLNAYLRLIEKADAWDESVESIITRMSIGQKNRNTAQAMKSTFLRFYNEYLVKGQISTSPKNQVSNVFSVEQSKKEFKENLLKVCNEIKRDQTNRDLDRMVSFYIREGKQLLKLYGYLSEKMLLATIPARFNKKADDVARVENIIRKYFPNPSTKTDLELPQKGKFLETVLKNGAEIAQINNEVIDPRSLKHEDKIPTSDPNYEYLDHERELITALFMANENLWITGSAGLGKSTMLQQFAFEEKLPIIRVGCNYEADPSDMFYKQSFNGQRVIYYVQYVGQAFLIANQIGACIVVLEELNSSNEATMIALHSATDEIKELDTEIGKISLNKGVKCLIVGTGNIGYKGTNDLTPALQSRLLPYEKETPSDQFVLEKIWK